MNDDTLKQDVYTKVSSILGNAALWSGTAFTVYRDFDMEGMAVEPPRPFIFLGSRNTAVIPRFIPYIMLDIEIDPVVVQMGSMSDLVRVTINILGRTEGEVSRLSSVLKKNMVTFGSTYSAQQQPDNRGAYWSETAVSIPEPFWGEGALRQVVAISSEFIVL